MYNFKKGFYADVKCEDRVATRIEYVCGKLTEQRVRKEKRAFIRVFDGKMWYYSSTDNLDEVQQKLDNLYELATYNSKIEKNKIVRKFQVNSDVLMQFSVNSVRYIDINDKKALVLKYLPTLSKVPYSSMHQAVYMDTNSIFEFTSSKGAFIKHDYQYCYLWLSCALNNGKNHFNGYYFASDNDFSKMNSLKTKIKESFSEQVNFMQNAKPIVPGMYPVILSPEAAGIFAHEAFGHKSEADYMLGDNNAKKDWHIGKKVGADILSIVDCGLIKTHGYCPYDNDGTKAKKNYLIKDGVLSGRLHNGITACSFNEKLTGNSRAVDCESEPLVRMTNTYIEAGKSTKEKLFAGVKHGYYIKSVSYGTGLGEFTLAPSLAYEIVDGAIGAPVKINMVKGDIIKTLNYIDGVSDKVELHSGFCGKNDQNGLPISDGGPYVRVSQIFVQ